MNNAYEFTNLIQAVGEVIATWASCEDDAPMSYLDSDIKALEDAWNEARRESNA
jgi:hypothetical protein